MAIKTKQIIQLVDGVPQWSQSKRDIDIDPEDEARREREWAEMGVEKQMAMVGEALTMK